MACSPGNDPPPILDAPDGLQPAPRISFEDFYREHFRAVLAIAYGLTGTPWAAEELAQEAFLAAHRSWERLRSHDRPDLWIRRVVANLATSRVRRRIAEGKALARLAARRPARAAEPVEDAQLWREVRLLPSRQGQTVVLKYVDDRSTREIAEILGCAEGTVKSHLARARRTLGARLGFSLPEEEHA